MAAFGSKLGNDPMCKWLPGQFFESVLEDKAVLELTNNKHLRNRVLEPHVQLTKHVVHVGIDKPIQIIGLEAKPWRCLKKAVCAPVRATPCWHQLPETETNDA